METGAGSVPATEAGAALPVGGRGLRGYVVEYSIIPNKNRFQRLEEKRLRIALVLRRCPAVVICPGSFPRSFRPSVVLPPAVVLLSFLLSCCSSVLACHPFRACLARA